jgi:hypothetical protein
MFSGFQKHLLANLGKDSALAQGICECLGLYAKAHPIVPELFAHVRKNQVVECCILLSALFAHVVVPGEFLSEAIVFLTSMMKNRKYAAIATHAMSSLFQTHQMQLSSVDIAYDQFLRLFELLHSNISLQPLTLRVLGEYFGYLIESFPTELSSRYSLWVELILRTIEMTPIPYAREVYFESSRSIYSFAHQMSGLAPITYPKSTYGQTSMQLTACAAFSDFLKFEEIEFEVPGLLRKVLTLLQRTGDERASHFIISVASLMGESDVSFWISMIKRILIGGSLLEGRFTIEPSPDVKETCIRIANFVVPKIAEAEVLSTAHLDDVISSVCRATETDRVSLQEAAFPPLHKVIELFKHRVTDDNQRLLDLYDSQFSTAVKIGFRVNLAISSDFLTSYLMFNTDNMASHPENCASILVVYLTGLRECQQRTSSYFSIATHLCTVARKYPPLRALIEPFLTTLTPIFSEIVFQVINLYRPTSDWREMARFRSLASHFYRELLPAFVWLQHISESVIDANVLVSFFLIELKSKRETWITVAAFDVLPVAIQFFGSTLSPDLLALSVSVAHDYYQRHQSIISIQTWDDLLFNAAGVLQSSPEYDHLRELILSLVISSGKFPHSVIGLLLKSDERKSLARFSLVIFAYTLRTWQEKSTSALLCVLFNHSPSITGYSIELALGKQSLPYTFKIDVISSGLTFLRDRIPLEAISQFIILAFREGAMHLLGRILVDREDIGVAVLADGAARAAFLLTQVERRNARAYLRFIHLCLSVLQKYPRIKGPFATATLRFAVDTIARYGEDTMSHGKQIVFQCVQIVKECIGLLGARVDNTVWESLEREEREQAVRFAEKFIRGVEQKKKTENLLAFSTNDRGEKVGEWESLEIEGDKGDNL